MVGVMAMLDGVSQSAGGGRIPEWLATHPDPGNRKEHIQGLIDMNAEAYPGSTVNSAQYLNHIDGIVFGHNPREGFFKENVFYHPDLKFRFEFPPGWQKTNTKQGVVGISPDQDAIIQITLTDSPSIEAAANEFFSQQGLSAGSPRTGEINGLPEITGDFAVATDQGVFLGQATFLRHEGIVYQLLGYSVEQYWSGYRSIITDSVRSFHRLNDQKMLSVQPLRVRIVTLDEAMTFEDFTRRYPSAISIETLMLINRASLDEQLRAGRKLKQVVGERID
jgi:predicted Zn-dependent protease